MIDCVEQKCIANSVQVRHDRNSSCTLLMIMRIDFLVNISPYLHSIPLHFTVRIARSQTALDSWLCLFLAMNCHTVHSLEGNGEFATCLATQNKADVYRSAYFNCSRCIPPQNKLRRNDCLFHSLIQVIHNHHDTGTYHEHIDRIKFPALWWMFTHISRESPMSQQMWGCSPETLFLPHG